MVMELKHSVRAELTVQELTRAGTSLELKIYAEHEQIGTLIIGQGSLFWRGGKKKKDKRIDWSSFAEMMNAKVYGR
ncbi:MAG TPA: hypothetical protein VEY33_15005 [Gemmatimonadota bacterium]|nr:hypothetical protein [Gemmatimonadota bacterium]